jgi:hypothetical protein
MCILLHERSQSEKAVLPYSNYTKVKTMQTVKRELLPEIREDRGMNRQNTGFLGQ